MNLHDWECDRPMINCPSNCNQIELKRLIDMDTICGHSFVYLCVYYSCGIYKLWNSLNISRNYFSAADSIIYNRFKLCYLILWRGRNVYKLRRACSGIYWNSICMLETKKDCKPYGGKQNLRAKLTQKIKKLCIWFSSKIKLLRNSI